MDTWTKQSSFPIITLSRVKGNQSFLISQESFIEAKARHEGERNTTEPTLWQVPFTYISDESFDVKTVWLTSKGKFFIVCELFFSI